MCLERDVCNDQILSKVSGTKTYQMVFSVPGIRCFLNFASKERMSFNYLTAANKGRVISRGRCCSEVCEQVYSFVPMSQDECQTTGRWPRWESVQLQANLPLG